MMERAARLAARLRREGHGAPSTAWFVPGRIEVFGKHTDYGGGRSLICAAERGFCLIASARADRQVVIHDATRESMLISSLEPDGPAPEQRWFNYPLTVIRRLARNFTSARLGMTLVFDSDLPSASGMSSSSVLMIGVALALADINRLDADQRWRVNIRTVEDLAAYLATVENGETFGTLEGDRGVGTAGGSEDHTAILCSEPGTLGLFRFCPTVRERTVSLPGDLVFAIAASGIAARKTGEAKARYNRASRMASRVLTYWQHDTGREDRSLAAALASSPDAGDRLRAIIAAVADAEFGAAALTDRLQHFIEESEVLVPRAAESLERGDTAAFGDAAARSQAIAESLLHNQVPETTALARRARDHGALAASAFGAGFGGSVWALVRRPDADAFVDRWARSYRSEYPDAAGRASFFLTRPGPAARRLDVRSL